MYRAFNMGVGMVVVADPADASSVMAAAAGAGVRAWPLGRVGAGTGQVQLVAR
jgi:phosphoribosylaminoimidazole (AIR) synthetase